MAETNEAPRRFEPWPWALAGMLALMIASSLSLWAIATANPDGVVGDAWEAGLVYNEIIAARRAADALGVELAIESAATRDGARITVRVEDALADAVVVERIRPAESGYDQEFALKIDSGTWRGVVPLPLPGRWRFRVRADLVEGSLQREIDYWHTLAGRADR